MGPKIDVMERVKKFQLLGCIGLSFFQFVSFFKKNDREREGQKCVMQLTLGQHFFSMLTKKEKQPFPIQPEPEPEGLAGAVPPSTVSFL
jgi:hypothetical protein